MAKPSFARIKNGDDTYPTRSFDGGENQSYGFSPAFKMQSGTLRGTQGVGGENVRIDSANQAIKIGKIPLAEVVENDYAVVMSNEGFSISDGTTTFISITKDGFVMNDGENDRVLIGKDEGGF